MSNKKNNIYTSVYDTYGKALKALIEERKSVDSNYSQSELARAINSSASQVNRWVNTSMTPVDRTQDDIEEELSARIVETDQGWEIDPIDKVSEKVHKFNSRKSDQDNTRTERDVLIEYLQDRVISLSKELADVADRLSDLKNHHSAG